MVEVIKSAKMGLVLAWSLEMLLPVVASSPTDGLLWAVPSGVLSAQLHWGWTCLVGHHSQEATYPRPIRRSLHTLHCLHLIWIWSELKSYLRAVQEFSPERLKTSICLCWGSLLKTLKHFLKYTIILFLCASRYKHVFHHTHSGLAILEYFWHPSLEMLWGWCNARW